MEQVEEITVPMQHEEISEDGNTPDVIGNYVENVATILQALQIEPKQVPVYDCTTIADLYWFHFEDQNETNDALFVELIQDASAMLHLPISQEDTVYHLASKLM